MYSKEFTGSKANFTQREVFNYLFVGFLSYAMTYMFRQIIMEKRQGCMFNHHIGLTNL